jgi:DNA-directed RNA polymerase subunit H (RpoH/RPB5)
MKDSVSPFRHVAQKLREENYPDQASVERATGVVRWLEWLAKQLPWVQTKDPVIAACIAKCANDGQARKELIQALQALEAEVARASQATPAPKNGYKIAD